MSGSPRDDWSTKGWASSTELACDLGEIDLVLRDGGCPGLLRGEETQSVAFGHPLEAVTRRRPNGCDAWRCGVEEHEAQPGGIRIDMVGVLLAERGAAEVEQVRGVG